MKQFAILLSVAISASLLAAVDTTNVVMSPPLTMRQRFNRDAEMRSNQISQQSLQTLRQRAWEAKEYAASSNIVAKITTMLSPLNAKGQIISVDVLTYYVGGKMRYATGCVDLATGQ